LWSLPASNLAFSLDNVSSPQLPLDRL
jgi:hypothetical protein